MRESDTTQVVPLLIIGAGPHALTLLCRLLEQEPDRSIDARLREVRPKAQLEREWCRRAADPVVRHSTAEWLRQNVVVVDDRGKWLSRWSEQFTGLHIPHLRSSLSVHPDPTSSYALEAFAEQTRRANDVVEMKMMPRSVNFAGPFALPGTKLFEAFSDDLVRRYCLDDIVRQAKVVSLTPVLHTTSGSYSHCVATTADGTQLLARRVVCAIGGTNIARVPEWAAGLTPTTLSPCATPPCHSVSPATTTAVVPTNPPATTTVATGFLPNPLTTTATTTTTMDTVSASPPAAIATGPSAVIAADSPPALSNTAPTCSAAPAPGGPPTTRAAADALLAAGMLPPGLMLHAWDVARAFNARAVAATDTVAATIPTTTTCGRTNRSTVTSQRRGGKSCQRCPLLTNTTPGNTAPGKAPLPAPGADSKQRRPEQPPTTSLSDVTGGLLCGSRVVVVGGGLTSAQLALLAVQQGCRDVVVLMRSKLKVKQFDADLEFMGRNRAALLRRFDRLDGGGEMRLAELRAAIGGGSITPEAAMTLARHVQAGSVRVVQDEEVLGAEHLNGRWALTLANTGTQLEAVDLTRAAEGSCACGKPRGGADDDDDDGDACDGVACGTAATALPTPSHAPYSSFSGELHADHVWLATGSVADVRREPLFAGLVAAHPQLEVHGGLPLLGSDLRVHPDWDVFVMGAFAALALGPGAVNIAGAKTASVIVVDALRRTGGSSAAAIQSNVRVPPRAGQGQDYHARASSRTTKGQDSDSRSSGSRDSELQGDSGSRSGGRSSSSELHIGSGSRGGSRSSSELHPSSSSELHLSSGSDGEDVLESTAGVAGDDNWLVALEVALRRRQGGHSCRAPGGGGKRAGLSVATSGGQAGGLRAAGLAVGGQRAVGAQQWVPGHAQPATWAPP